MGIETLNTAARAAGFAMAASEEVAPESKETAVPTEGWSAEQDQLAAERPAKSEPATDWFKSLFAVFGRGAPA